MVTQIFTVGLAIMQLCGGIGALGVYRWARNLLIVWVVASIAITIAQVIGQAILSLPAINSLQPPAGTPMTAYRMGLHIAIMYLTNHPIHAAILA